MKYLLTLTILLYGCSNANMSAIRALGKKHVVKCYSGGVVIYEGFTTGKVENEGHSDGYYFEDQATNRFVTVSGNCVITVDNK